VKTATIIALTAALTCVAAPAAAELTQSPSYVRVVFMEDPAREATVSWVTGAEGSGQKLMLDTEPGGGADGAYDLSWEQVETGPLGGDADPWFHHAVATGLEPATRYYFVVETDGERTEERWFVTAPGDDAPVTFLYGGDSRSDWPQRRAMNVAMRDLFAADDRIFALVHGGDFIDDGFDLGEWLQWLSDHELTTREDGRVLPIVPTRGNHERDGVIFDELFGFPGGQGAENNWFAAKLSNHTVLLTLDSQASVYGDQRVWLEQQLYDNREMPWIFASYHTPAYPAVKIPGPARLAWVPLFEKYLVDVVFENDGHVLKRTVPILDDAQHPDGVVYVGEGGLGVKQRVPDMSRWYLQSPGMAASAHHVQKVTVDATSFTYEALLEDGTVTDTWTRTPRATRGELPDFEAVDAYTRGEDLIELVFSTALDVETSLDQFTFEPALPIDRVLLVRDDKVARFVASEPLPQGVDVAVTITGLTDSIGRPLPQTTLNFRVGGEPEGGEDAGPEGGADAGPEGGADAGADAGVAAPDAGGPPPVGDGGEEMDDTGCASTGLAASAGSAGGGGLIALALWWVVGLRRRRD
jgi:hypothetical protein